VQECLGIRSLVLPEIGRYDNTGDEINEKKKYIIKAECTVKI
jgi:hypothetical protein